jgi:HEAT repeat protein
MRKPIWTIICLLSLSLGVCAGCGNESTPPEDEPPTPKTAGDAETNIPPEASALIRQLIDPATRDQAADVIESRGAASVSALTDALSHGDSQVRASAAFALSLLGKDAVPALPALKKIAETDKQETARDAALNAIAAIEE